MIVQFPRSRMRRILSRRPRRSKNGTPEERAAQLANDGSAEPRVVKRRQSKNGTFQERQAKRTARAAAVIAFDPQQPRKVDPECPMNTEDSEQRFDAAVQPEPAA